jgi:hypothetical protein
MHSHEAESILQHLPRCSEKQISREELNVGEKKADLYP